MERAETNTTPVTAPNVPVGRIGRTLRDFILWSYERGTIQYDVMVTLILMFVFFSPALINFKDKPVDHNPHRTEVVVTPDGQGGLIYQVEGSAVTSNDDPGRQTELLHIIEPISGNVTITKVEPVRDAAGHILRYKVWAER